MPGFKSYRRKRYQRKSTRRFNKRFKRGKMVIHRPFMKKTVNAILDFDVLFNVSHDLAGVGLIAIQTRCPYVPVYKLNLGTVTPGSATALGATGRVAVADYYGAGANASMSTMYGNMWDMMKTVGISIEYTPDSLINTAAIYNAPIYTWFDPDNTYLVVPNLTVSQELTSGTGGIAYYQDYSSLKRNQSLRAFKRFFKIPRVASGSPNTGAFSSINTVDVKGFYNTGTGIQNGVIYVYYNDKSTGASLAVDTQIGIIRIKYYVVYKWRV